jgi:hypothetical protein
MRSRDSASGEIPLDSSLGTLPPCLNDALSGPVDPLLRISPSDMPASWGAEVAITKT